ncbi:hypothetical protein H310_14857 [Aphanomyces invadans]|uniref:Uncharacterized protein n=1 Tax=Aphanomyces invadans TaxID=157072 RepID=A0A024TAJ8_9STRA|nr:hypothetical protein H310_14857 [Aphanomyces invadans]ETV90347.1 hypothetical protein H310_14857 [Aphanomyces invadans]|eukprot:XP_008881021.1 hypothetical protein H310_14857 [Aphanomyces invadans]
MYIGPWQEYKLAKIQDAAVQKLRKEWEEHLKSTIIGQGDEECIRQMMEPILSKLPAMLLANRTKEVVPPTTHRKSRRSLLTGRSIPSNQDSPNHDPREVILAPTKKLVKRQTTKPKTPRVSTSIDEVARRRQRWTAPAAENTPSTTPTHREDVHLPSITPHTALQPVIPQGPPTASVRPPVQLPMIDMSSPLPQQPEDDEDSLDEDELNSFLTWTDQLSHPDADLDQFSTT